MTRSSLLSCVYDYSDLRLLQLLTRLAAAIDAIVSTNLVGSILCTCEVMHVMCNQNKAGYIFNMEDAGSGGSSTYLTAV
ncbi:hypothetical protein Tco_1380840 [Tanacetum coccineum]